MFAYLFDGKGYGSQDSAPGMQVGSSGRGGARFEEEAPRFSFVNHMIITLMPISSYVFNITHGDP